MFYINFNYNLFFNSFTNSLSFTVVCSDVAIFLSVAKSLSNSSSPITIVYLAFILSEYLNWAFKLFPKWSISALIWLSLRDFTKPKLLVLAWSPIVAMYISVALGFSISILLFSKVNYNLSAPKPNPIPLIPFGPPSCSTRPSYLPPPQTVLCEPISFDIISKAVFL